ncbi:MAG: anti-sigma factor family protein [Bacteroidota bacterium]
MNHEEQLVLYAAGQLEGSERAEFEAHLAGCTDCQEDLKIWMAVSDEIVISASTASAPLHLSDSALDAIHRPSKPAQVFHRAGQLLRAQAFLVQREMFPATAAVMALGVIVALLSKHVEFMYFIAPMVAAASFTVLFGTEQDPAYELILSTSTSPWKVLLARVSLISAYNLLLVLGTAFLLLFFIPPDVLGLLIFGWLAPMAFLSALALLLSLWMGTGNAIIITYILWVAQYIPYKAVGTWVLSPAWSSLISAYQQFWHSPLFMLLLSIPLFVIALLSTNRPAFRLAD